MKDTPETIHLSEEMGEKLFSIAARKVRLTHPETGEEFILGDNWKTFRDQLSGYPKRVFDTKVLQVIMELLTDASHD